MRFLEKLGTSYAFKVRKSCHGLQQKGVSMATTNDRNLIVSFSYSGNNQILAQRLAEDLNADHCPIVEIKKRSNLTLFLDIFLQRTPKIRDLERPLSNYDHVIFLAPLWAGRIANPLKTLLLKEKDHIRDYSFVTLCGGYEKKDQMTKVKDELQKLTGKGPKHIFELDVSDLLPPEKRKDTRTISSYHLKPNELKAFDQKLTEIEAAFR